MVRVLGKRAKDQLVTLCVAVRVPPPSAWPDKAESCGADLEKLLAEGCHALPARRMAGSIVAAVRTTLAELGGVRYVTGRAAEDGRGLSRGRRLACSQEVPYVEVYDACWLPETVPETALAAAAAAGASDTTRDKLESAKTTTSLTTRTTTTTMPPRRKRARAVMEDTFSALTGATRASDEVLRWTRQLRVRLMWRPPGGRGRTSQNLLRTACATLMHVPVLLPTKGESTPHDAPPAPTHRSWDREPLCLSVQVAVRVHHP